MHYYAKMGIIMQKNASDTFMYYDCEFRINVVAVFRARWLDFINE